MAAEASSAGSRHFKAHRFGLTGIDQLSRVVGNMDMRDAERCQCIEDRVDVGLRRGPACRVSGARTITCWRVGYWAVGSQWLNRESKMGSRWPARISGAVHVKLLLWPRSTGIASPTLIAAVSLSTVTAMMNLL